MLASVGIGAGAIIVDGAPGLGTDFGGVLALGPGLAILVLMLAGIRLSVARLVAIGVGTVAVVAALAVVDWDPPGRGPYAPRRVRAGRHRRQCAGGHRAQGRREPGAVRERPDHRDRRGAAARRGGARGGPSAAAQPRRPGPGPGSRPRLARVADRSADHRAAPASRPTTPASSSRPSRCSPEPRCSSRSGHKHWSETSAVTLGRPWNQTSRS